MEQKLKQVSNKKWIYKYTQKVQTINILGFRIQKIDLPDLRSKKNNESTNNI